MHHKGQGDGAQISQLGHIQSVALKMFKFVVFLCVIFARLAAVSDCARILAISHTATYSHFSVGEAFFKELAKRGHAVTVISAFPQKNPIKNYRDIGLKKVALAVAENRKKDDLYELSHFHMYLDPIYLGQFALKLTELVFEEAAVQDLLESGEKFDLVIVEQFVNDALKGFACRFNAPFIVFSAIRNTLWTNHLVGNSISVAYTPNFLLNYSSRMTFFQRILNTIVTTYTYLYYHLHFYKKQNEILHKYIPDAPHLSDLMHNVSLVLLNSHVSIYSPQPLLPNMIEVGGWHIKEPEGLSKDLKRFLDESVDGVIYFAFGSRAKSKDMSKTKIEQILKVFGKLKMRVLWKFEEDSLTNLPKNLKVAKWFPQQDILAHPNVKLFISHGGLLSIMEAVHYGVPILGIPVYGDQRMNMAETLEKGYGLLLQYHQLDENSFYSTIKELIDNPKYAENVKKGSSIFRDRQSKPLDTAVYWVEYVLRHRGAPHHRSVSLDLRWYQHILLDVIALLIVAVAIIVAMSCTLLKCLLKRRKQARAKQH